jgi:hypothetical protein
MPDSKHKTAKAHKTPAPHHSDAYSHVLRGEVACTNPYAAFAPKPVFAAFESQAHDERILLMIRRHPFVELRWVIIAIILFLMPFALRFFPLLDFFPSSFQLFAVIGWYMLILGYVIENFLSWFFHVNIITDERIIDINFLSLLYKRIASAKIEKIEDVTSGVQGFFGAMLNYGNVEIQTAAEQREFIFDLVPQPEKVSRLLNELILEEEKEKLEGRVN